MTETSTKVDLLEQSLKLAELVSDTQVCSVDNKLNLAKLLHALSKELELRGDAETRYVELLERCLTEAASSSVLNTLKGEASATPS